MAVPALALTLGGWVRWEVAAANPTALWSAVLLMAGVAVAEELLFRGVLFQRLIAGIGLWPAQIVIGLFFVLTHLGNPGMEGATKIWAGVNIFAASILFGLAYVRTRSLALPIGLHFMANVTQGIVFGFGVSGAAEPSVLSPVRVAGMDWLTGGAFGLEASLPGLIAVLAFAAAFAWRIGSRPRSSSSRMDRRTSASSRPRAATATGQCRPCRFPPASPSVFGWSVAAPNTPSTPEWAPTPGSGPACFTWRRTMALP